MMAYEELIQRYFSNSLSKEEAQKVAHLLKTDSSFKTLFEEHNDLHNALKHQEKKELKTFLNEVDRKSSSPYTIWSKYKAIIIAVASCFVIGLLYVFTFNHNDDLFETYFEPYPNVYSPVVRGEATSLAKAFKAYENGNYPIAEEAFKDLLDSDPNLKFYYAMSLLNQDKISEASMVIADLKTETHKFLPETFWYDILILLKQEKYLEAKDVMVKLQKLDPDFKKKELKELLGLIEDKIQTP